jgi:hypothetical protein
MNRKHTRTFRPTLEHLEDRCVPSAGFLDPTFNTTGVVTTRFATGGASGCAMALYPSGIANAGKIVSVGQASDGANDDFGLVRYNPDG